MMKNLGLAANDIGSLQKMDWPSLIAAGNGAITKGDVAILQFLAAAELIETDLWQQYAELGGVTAGTQNPYQLALQQLDGDGSQYITSNTLDENSHALFLNAYLESKGAAPVNLNKFRTLPSSQATGAKNIGRLTNLMNLNVDLSWYTRYRSSQNPDFGTHFKGPFVIKNEPAIPLNDTDTPPNQPQPVPPATPPEARQPIRTYIHEDDAAVTADAIRRELARDGQVYVVHNRVETIDRAAERIRRLVPEARVVVAHGQMPETQLEGIMLDFLGGRADVLVCTTIVEIGLDIPRVNTILVENAHLLGLAQLYQLRGRVGRADRQAYAYLLHPRGARLTPEAEQRLVAMREFVELGSGMRLAMRDCAIRVCTRGPAAAAERRRLLAVNNPEHLIVSLGDFSNGDKCQPLAVR